MKVRSSQLTRHHTACAPARLPVPVTLSPGITTSVIVNQMTGAPGRELLINHPVVEAPAGSNGLPFSTTNRAAKHLPISDLGRAIHGADLPVRLPDDLGQASPAMRAARMQLQPGRRRVGDPVWRDHVTLPVATIGLHADIAAAHIDSPRATHAIAKAAQADLCRYFPDCGDETFRGQVVSGEFCRSRCDRRADEGGVSSEQPEPVPTDAAARARSGHEALREKRPRNAQEGGRA
jgi:hypothetical protein